MIEMDGLEGASKCLGVPRALVSAMLDRLDSYTRKHRAEACGLLVGWPCADGRRGLKFQVLPNIVGNLDPVDLFGTREQHEFQMSYAAAEAVTLRLGEIGGEIVAVVHSHPYASPGELGWDGPSIVDIRQRGEAEVEVSAARHSLPQSVVWCPRAGARGVLVGYNSGGATWRVGL